ncbi:amidohydrolase family protein, partial [Longimicrobium sp.]
MVRLTGETQSATLETARRLREAGITVALQSGYEGYVPKTRVVLFEAAIAAANGMAFEDALRTITIDAARVIGLGDRVGSLERGKDGDVAVFDGDPFEYTSHVCAVVIEGQVVSETCR